METPKKTFEELGRIYGTDKVHHHGYQRFYPRYLESLRDTATGVLEIGVDYHRSLLLWKEYFSSAHVYGIDINEKSSTDSRITVLKADQSKLADLETLCPKISHAIQLILDDGSHIPEHQLLSFNYLFDKLLEPGGVYIVEDVETSYWSRGGLYGYETRYGYRHHNSFIEKVKPIVDTINREFLLPSAIRHNSHELSDFSATVLSMIGTITFGHNCVIITKKTMDELAVYSRDYVFARRL